MFLRKSAGDSKSEKKTERKYKQVGELEGKSEGYESLIERGEKGREEKGDLNVINSSFLTRVLSLEGPEAFSLH